MRPHDARQGVADSETGMNAQSVEVGAEPGLGRSHAEVSDQGKPQSGADGSALYRRNDGFPVREKPHGLRVERRRVERRAVFGLIEIRSSAKHAAATA
ncbi:hypothetical protein D9M68_888490 [compost metagenome]